LALDKDLSEKRDKLLAKATTQFADAMTKAVKVYEALPDYFKTWDIYSSEKLSDILKSLGLQVKPVKIRANAKSNGAAKSKVDPSKPKATNEEILAFIKENGPVSKKDVARFANLVNITLNKRLKEAELKGKIHEEPKGTSIMLSVK
jgi:predicted HTH transcriptional regulator